MRSDSVVHPNIVHVHWVSLSVYGVVPKTMFIHLL